MEPLLGYSLDKSHNMVLMGGGGGLMGDIPITRTTFLFGTLGLCGVPLLAYFWSKDEILSESWLYLSSFAVIAYFLSDEIYVEMNSLNRVID